MKRILFILLFFPVIGFAQITSTGYSGDQWKMSPSNIKHLSNCDTKHSGKNFSNCESLLADSLFLKKYKYSFCNYRFYKDKLSEIHFDLRHQDLGNLISELTMTYGAPKIKENQIVSLDMQENSIGYEWRIGDTKLLIINKGNMRSVWCRLSSAKMQSKYPRNIKDIDKLIF